MACRSAGWRAASRARDAVLQWRPCLATSSLGVRCFLRNQHSPIHQPRRHYQQPWAWPARRGAVPTRSIIPQLLGGSFSRNRLSPDVDAAERGGDTKFAVQRRPSRYEREARARSRDALAFARAVRFLIVLHRTAVRLASGRRFAAQHLRSSPAIHVAGSFERSRMRESV